ncbi:MAG TPA: CARDB domain-containing protein, partial [Pirellulaceae bacterium]|nr:CARDB domain-containing protein [Pirellulaceae bacterium]
HVSGDLFITAWANPYGTVIEDTLDTNLNPDDPFELDNNNYKARPMTVLLTPPPDLVVTSIISPAQTVAGNSYTIEWTVRNQGTSPTEDAIWYDDLFLTDSPTLATAGVRRWELGRVQHTGVLAPGASYTERRTVTLAPNVSGRYLIVGTNLDVLGGTWEGPYRDNNTLTANSVVTTAPADLQVTSVVAPPISYSGENTLITWTVTNFGAPVWAGTQYWTDRVYFSADPTFIPARATLVGTYQRAATQTLPTGGSYTESHGVTLPRGIGGDFYIYVFTDYDPFFPPPLTPSQAGNNNGALLLYRDRVFEGENPAERNNMGSAPLPVVYREPDLQVTDLVVPAAAFSGQTIDVSWTVTNKGTRATRTSLWLDAVFLGESPSHRLDDELVGGYTNDGVLQVGQSYTRTTRVSIPDGISGTYYIHVYADDVTRWGGMAKVEEFQDEGNNVTSMALPITLTTPPDLQVTAINVPQHVIAGQLFDMNFTVTNVGAGPTAPGQAQWEDRVYFSVDPLLDVDRDSFLGAVVHRGALPVNASYSVSQRLRAPRDFDGPFYLFVLTDAPNWASPGGAVFEGTNEGNNASPTPQPVIIDQPPPADLQVDSIVVPPAGLAGAPVHVEWSVSNHGQFPATGDWTDAVYLSADATWDIRDKLVGRVARERMSLSTGQGYSSTFDGVLPPVKPGTYHLIVRTDLFDEVREGAEEANNRQSSADIITVNAPALQPGVPLSTSLSTGQERLYQITVGVGLTLKVDLTTPATNAANEIYIRHGDVPTAFEYDAAYSGMLQPNQT